MELHPLVPPGVAQFSARVLYTARETLTQKAVVGSALAFTQMPLHPLPYKGWKNRYFAPSWRGHKLRYYDFLEITALGGGPFIVEGWVVALEAEGWLSSWELGAASGIRRPWQTCAFGAVAEFCIHSVTSTGSSVPDIQRTLSMFD